MKVSIPILRDTDNSYPDGDVEFQFSDNDPTVEMIIEGSDRTIGLDKRELIKLLKVITA